MRIRDIADTIERFAPLSLQESYDNSGLIVGRYEQEVHHALLAVDVTEEVLDVGGRVEALPGVEDYGVVRYYDVASVSLGLVEHLLGNVYGQQRMVHLLLVSPDDQPRDRKSTRLNSSHRHTSRMPSSA